MCGICGYLLTNKKRRMKYEIIKKMADVLTHRGPDEEGFYSDDIVALGHKRLSIIDLNTGRQPIHNEDYNIWVILNGEIYNYLELREFLIKKGHKFYTRSDTEVIVHLYEEYQEDCISKIEGMFAFCIWDKEKKMMLLARDRMGKKPLYYTFINNEFIFASEIKSILKWHNFKKELNWYSLIKYLIFGYVPSPNTIFKKINKLPAAHFLIIDRKGRIKIRKYWELKFYLKRNKSEKEIVEDVNALLVKAVKRRLISDVPLGLFLSGGVDSSLVVAVATQISSAKKINAFTIGFKENIYDESKYAKIVATHLGINHYLSILSYKKCIELIPEVLSLLDEPIADPSIIPTFLLSKLTRENVKVALSGDGGDEVFAGYPKYCAHRLALWFDFLPQMIREEICKFSPYLPINHNIKRFLLGLRYSPTVRNQLWVAHFMPQEVKGLLTEVNIKKEEDLILEDIHLYSNKEIKDIMDQMFYLDIKLTLQDLYLTKVDRASMFCSLEIRSPFLDRELVEFGASLPVSLKLKGMNAKYILKRLAEKYLPKEIIYRPKRGFGIPLYEWFLGNLKEFVLSVLNRKNIKRFNVFRVERVDEILKEFYNGKKDNYIKIWNLLTVQIWFNSWY